MWAGLADISILLRGSGLGIRDSVRAILDPAFKSRFPNPDSRPSERRDFATILAISLLLVAATRLPLMPTHLFSFDSANLAFALEEFDPARSQPQPPGYPLFVGEAKLLNALFTSPERTFTFLKVFVSGISVALLYLLGRSMLSSRAGLIAAALFLTNPPLWYSGLTSALRPHAAVFAILVAYCCWRAWRGEERFFFLACMALGFGAGFRPVLLIRLFPLVVWTGWRVGRWRSLWRGALLVAAASSVWIAVLIQSCGGLVKTMQVFARYSQEQAVITSVVFGASLAGWRRMVGRALLWNGVWTLSWLWALPIVWRHRQEHPELAVHLRFIGLWLIPSFLVSLLVHIAEPDHALATIPATCLLGALVILIAEQNLRFAWLAKLKQRGLAIWLMGVSSVALLWFARQPYQKWIVVWVAVAGAFLFLWPQKPGLVRDHPDSGGRGAILCLALLINTFLFFIPVETPHSNMSTEFRGWKSLKDAFLIGNFESSYSRVRWSGEKTASAITDIAEMDAQSDRPLIVVWSKDGHPVWRKVAYYYPTTPVYEVGEKGYPGYRENIVRVWKGKSLQSQFKGNYPIVVPIPKESRVVWVVEEGREKELQAIVTLRKARSLYYTDLEPQAGSFRWGNFEFVPGGESFDVAATP